MQDISGSAESLRCKGAQKTDQRRPDQHELPLTNQEMVKQPELNFQELTEQCRDVLLLRLFSGVVHTSFSGCRVGAAWQNGCYFDDGTFVYDELENPAVACLRGELVISLDYLRSEEAKDCHGDPWPGGGFFLADRAKRRRCRCPGN